jgi:hypothetical protein
MSAAPSLGSISAKRHSAPASLFRRGDVVVGTTRAAISTLRDKTAHWALKLIALLVFVGVALLLLGLANDLVIIRHWLLGFISALAR